MARHRRKKNTANSQQADNLGILFPDIKATVAGKEITMRELRFGEQLQYHQLMQPIATHFDNYNLEGNIDDSANNVLDILKLEYQNVIQLIAISCRQSIEWIKSVPAAEGEELMLLWWATNSRFFIRRQMRKAQLKAHLLATNLQTTIGEKSLPPSSKQGTIGNNSAPNIPNSK